MQINLTLRQKVLEQKELEDRLKQAENSNQAENFTFATLSMVKDAFDYESREPVRSSQKDNKQYVMQVKGELGVEKLIKEFGTVKINDALKTKMKGLAKYWPYTYINVHYPEAPAGDFHFYVGKQNKKTQNL